MSFPENFIWGTATSAHQTEGGNVNSDWWELEHRPDSPSAESSGDACDSYHRYPKDVSIVSELGLDSYRFSIEWSRIEPARGEFSRAHLDHYRRVIECVREAGLSPNITLQHFTVPRWFAKAGGWALRDAPDLFARYCEYLLPLLDGVEYVCTINEPNIASSLWNVSQQRAPQAAALPPPDRAVSDGLSAAHRAARRVLTSVPELKVGWSVATQVFRSVDGQADAARKYAYERETRFLEEARGDDWLGVQAYTRTIVDEDGPVPLPEGTETTLTGWEYWPAAVEHALRDAAAIVPDVPLLVTENGIATGDDARRVEYVRSAVEGVLAAIEDGIDVRGYFYWSLLDNFEWASGYKPTFGLVSVDRNSFERTLKPSARWFAKLAAEHRLPSPDADMTA